MVYSVSISGDGKNFTSVFNGIAASIQIADLERKGNMILYVSPDGAAFQQNPIYNAATNFHINFPAAGGNKEVYVSTDGAAFQQNPIYNAAAKNFFIQLAPSTQPPIPKPADGHVKPGGWGGNQDPFTWRVVSMQDDPTLFKIVDNNNTNIAHRFATQQEAQQFIDYEKSIYQRSATTRFTSRTNGGEIVEDGIKMFFPKIGDAQTFAFKSSNDKRSQYVCNLKKPLINMEVTGIIDLKKVDNPGEEVSIKTRGGPHSKGDKPAGCCYISGVKYNGKVNNQYECPHPDNHPMSLHEKPGKFNPGSVVGKKFGIKNIVYYDQGQDKDVIKVYLDMNLDNNWQLLFETTSTEFKNKENSKGEPKVFFRMDDIPGAPESDENAKLTKGTVREITLQ